MILDIKYAPQSPQTIIPLPPLFNTKSNNSVPGQLTNFVGRREYYLLFENILEKEIDES